MSGYHTRVTDETATLVNDLLPGSTALGAYAMGQFCAMALRRGLQPERLALESIRTAQSVADAQRLIDLWSNDLERNG